MPTFFLRTFGCKTNQYESQGIREALERAGFSAVPSAHTADVCVINTCAVTGRADASCRNAVRSCQRQNPVALIVVTGCCVDLAQEWPTTLGVPLIIPNPEKHTLSQRILSALEKSEMGCPASQDRFGLSITRFDGHTRAFLKIQDGCDNFCSYCTIPYARGVPQSRPLPHILDEAQALLTSGHRELVLTGINIGKYDTHGETLADLIRHLGKLPELLRLRLGSVEPPYVTDELIAAIKDTPVVCPHLHIPLQNGDDGILSAMNRKYSVAEFEETVARVRTALPAPAITTDIIVGFPGEDDTAFANTLALCERVGFSRIHAFLFSPRPGTPAAAMKQTSPNREITRRRDSLIALATESATAYANTWVGKTVNVLLEENENGMLAGYTDRYLRIRTETDPSLLKTLQQILVTDADGSELTGTIVPHATTSVYS